MSYLIRLPAAAMLCCLAAGAHAQNNTPPASPPANPAGNNKSAPPALHPLGLPRLKAPGRPEQPTMIATSRLTVDDLSPRDAVGVRSLSRQNLNVLAIAPGKSWVRPLRGSANDTTFVSFLVYGATGTTIDIGAAKLMIAPDTKPGHARMRIGRQVDKAVQWRSFGGPVKIDTYGGAQLAALPVLTVRLDPTAGVWDLFVANRLAASDLTLAALPAGATKRFSVRAGPQGAWVCGLVDADENPLFVDANANGIDDVFEAQQRGGSLLAVNAPAAERVQLAQQWQQDQNTRQTKPLPVRRPLPDNAPPGKGK